MSGGVGRALGIAMCAACLVAIVNPSDVRADSTHYQTLQLGERSRGMAAAYTMNQLRFSGPGEVTRAAALVEALYSSLDA